MRIDCIPMKLREEGLFCVHKNKVPFNPRTHGMAQANNPATFSDFETARRAFERGGYSGLGVGIFGNLGAIDIDSCITDDEIFPMAIDILTRMNSYAEVSPSGNGLRILFTVADNFYYDKSKYFIKNPKLELEIYTAASSRYVTLTSNRINENSVNERTSELIGVLDKYMTRPNNKPAPAVVITKPQLSTPVAQPTATAFNPNLLYALKTDWKLISYWYGNRPLKSESENDCGFLAKILQKVPDTDEAIMYFKSSPYAAQKDDYHKQKMARYDYLPRVAAFILSERNATQNNED